MRKNDRTGRVSGVFAELLARDPGADRHGRGDDGFYVTEDDLVFEIDGASYSRLGMDVDDSLCWIRHQKLMDNWYEGPYFDFLPLPEDVIEELGLRAIQKHYRFQPIKEAKPEDDDFFKLLARLGPDDAAYLESVRERARAEFERWQEVKPQVFRNETGTVVGGLDAFRRAGRLVLKSDWDSENDNRWCVATERGLPATFLAMMHLLEILEAGWALELYVIEGGPGSDPESAWDLPSLEEFLVFARRAYDREMPDLHLLRWVGQDEGLYSATHLLDPATGRKWIWEYESTIYYSDGIVRMRPYEVDPAK